MADAEQTLTELLDEILDELNYKPRETNIQAITTVGAHYTSALFLVSVSSPNRDDLKLFAKVANVGEKLRSQINADWLYGTERHIYTKLIKIYKDIEDKQSVPDEHRFKFPKVYGCNAKFGKETVVMESLVENGYKTYNRCKTMDWDHAAISIENLAKFHALSFAFAAHYPEEFDKFTVDMTYKTPSAELLEAGKGSLMKITNSLKILKKEHRDLMRPIIMDLKNVWGSFNTPIGKPVIVHGDYRPSNLLFRKQGDSVEVISVDYQTTYAGNPVCDLVYFIVAGTDEEFRQQYFHKLLDYYYTTLEAALKRLSVDPLKAYPREKFNSDLKKVIPYVLFLAITVLPVTVVDEPSLRGDGEDDTTNLDMKSNELFVQRFRGVVNDYFSGLMFKQDT